MYASVCLYISIQTAIVVNYELEKVAFGWRISLGLLCLFAMILVIGMLFLPESPRYIRTTLLLLIATASLKNIVQLHPCLLHYVCMCIRWLVKKHKDDKATKILARIHQKMPEECIQEELREIQTAVNNIGGEGLIQTFFTWKTIHRYY